MINEVKRDRIDQNAVYGTQKPDRRGDASRSLPVLHAIAGRTAIALRQGDQIVDRLQRGHRFRDFRKLSLPRSADP